jgi:hypothetical protein
VALLLAVLRAFAFLVSGKRERERELYGNAYRAAMAWRQMLYRVRTRPPGGAQELLNRFDELQVEIDYYQGWVSSEGRWIGRSYYRLVTEIQDKTIPLLQLAWKMSDEERLPTNDDRDAAGHPATQRDSERFFDDVRNHLSFLFFPKLWVIWRNRRRPKPPAAQRSTIPWRGAGAVNQGSLK